MKVVLVAYTPNPELIISKAMRSCRKKEAMYELQLKKSPEHYIKLAKKMGHYSVLEHANFTFSVKGVSRSCTHQLVRHRIASYSQQSLRAVDPSDGDEWYVTPETIKERKSFLFRDTMHKIKAIYKHLIDVGIPKEDARFILPIGTKTNIVITMNARELLHFFSLRLDSAAQWEIRLMAKGMLMEAKKVAPTIFEDVEYVDYEKDYE